MGNMGYNMGKVLARIWIFSLPIGLIAMYLTNHYGVWIQQSPAINGTEINMGLWQTCFIFNETQFFTINMINNF